MDVPHGRCCRRAHLRRHVLRTGLQAVQKVLKELETQTEYENPFAVTAEITTEETVLNYNIENGNISVTKSSGTFTTTFIDNEEFRIFLLYHSDWCFLGLDNFNSNKNIINCFFFL